MTSENVKKKIPVICYLFLLISLSMHAQEQMLFGKIVDSSNVSSNVSSLHIINKTSQSATISDENGLFGINVKLRDTLVITGIQFRAKTIIIDEEIILKNDIIVHLYKKTIELDEVVVKPFLFSGYLNNDINLLEYKPIVTAKSLGLPNSKKKSLKFKGLYYKNFNESNRFFLGNIFDGENKEIKKIRLLTHNNKITEKVKSFFTDSLFIKDLAISKSNIYDFLYYCEADSLFRNVVHTQDKLKLWEIIERKSVEYKLLQVGTN